MLGLQEGLQPALGSVSVKLLMGNADRCPGMGRNEATGYWRNVIAGVNSGLGLDLRHRCTLIVHLPNHLLVGDPDVVGVASSG